MKSKMYWGTKLLGRQELPKTVIDEVHTGLRSREILF